ncbi:MAG: L,D-transpeptidase [Duncaniella sp.]|nr:L,D-transpeptidase [Duncaniella sp.]
MKHLRIRNHILSLLFLYAPFTALAEGNDDRLLSEATARVIADFEGSQLPVLPDIDPEVWATIDSPCSSAPGRQRLPRHLLVDKPGRRLYVRNAFSDTLSQYPVCASSARGQKKKMDDCRTPEGDFRLMGVYDSTDWTYKDTGDKCYGPFFVSLITPRFYGIGIHGTNAPYSVPGRRSHGCMRMHNEAIVRVRQMVDKDSHVIILPDPEQDED